MANVLVTRFSSFGDVAMVVPVIASVAKDYPDDDFYVLTKKVYRPLFRLGLKNIKLINIDLKKDYKGIFGLLKLAKFIHRQYAIDYVVDIHDVLRTKVIRNYLNTKGIRTAVIDKGHSEKNALIRQKNVSKPVKHTVDRYFDVFKALDYPAEMTYKRFFEEVPHDASLLKLVAYDSRKTSIGIAPFAKYKEKTYPPQKMEKALAQLAEKPNVRIYLFGGKEDEEALRIWEAKYPNVVNTVGKLNLELEILLISYLSVIITMDSANMHLASLVGTPVVSIWGATHPSLGFYGFNQKPEDAVQLDIDCRPCSVYGDKKCHRKEELACMHAIHTAQIIERVNRYIP